ncbi:receptor-like protein 12-like [Hibiscus syriacus]|uniref:Receptor-like protein 12-like n=1 Tax=Hibiscus syriacus TaxID=106335 RepID=A0A6A2WP07_HIBSY|nr:receptor-like protein 12-like [Hibiscus syriacus]
MVKDTQILPTITYHVTFSPSKWSMDVSAKDIAFETPLILFVVRGNGGRLSIICMYSVRFFIFQQTGIVTPSSLHPWFYETDTIERWIRPPRNLWHSISDNELLWRASFVPKIKKYPFLRVPKIAFMFLTKGPLRWAPLWDKFFKGNQRHYLIYMVEWGKMSMCEAERRLLANALLDISNQWFVLLSESCIPLYNFSVIYHYLSRSKYSFMESYDDPRPYGRGRYDPRMEPKVELSQRRKGAQWFKVNRRLAINIIEDIKYYPKFKEFCQLACYVDEHYFTTMLTIQVPRLLANRTLTWTDWSRGGAHPATFGKEDMSEAFFQRIFEGQECVYNGHPTTICFLFVRKFSPSALDSLLELSSKFLRESHPANAVQRCIEFVHTSDLKILEEKPEQEASENLGMARFTLRLHQPRNGYLKGMAKMSMLTIMSKKNQ